MSFLNAKVWDAVIVPTYWYIDEDHSLPGARGSIARLDRVCELIREGVIERDATIPFPQAGVRERNGHLESLGENIATYAATLPELKIANIRYTPQSWGTWADTLASYKLIENNLPPGGSVHIHFVSDWSHLGRLWIIWQVTKPKGWTASFHLVPNFRTWKDILTHEPLRYFGLVFWKIPRYFFTGY
jgi:hypothetical protein